MSPKTKEWGRFVVGQIVIGICLFYLTFWFCFEVGEGKPWWKPPTVILLFLANAVWTILTGEGVRFFFALRERDKTHE